MGLCSHEDSSCCWDDTFVCEEFASSLGSQQEWGYFRMFSIAPYGCSTTWCEYFNTAGRTDSECLSEKDLGSTFSLPAQSCSLAAPQEGQLLFSGRTWGLDRTHCQQCPSHMRNHENLPYHKSRCYLFYLIFQHNHLNPHSVLLEEMDLLPRHPKTLPRKRTDLASYRQQMWHT